MTRQQYLADVARRMDNMRRRNEELEKRIKELTVKFMQQSVRLDEAENTIKQLMADRTESIG